MSKTTTETESDAGFWERLARAETHALRLRILTRLQRAEEPMSAGQLRREFDLPQQNVAYHVAELRDAGLIVETHTKQRRGAVEHFYRVAPVAAAAAGERVSA